MAEEHFDIPVVFEVDLDMLHIDEEKYNEASDVHSKNKRLKFIKGPCNNDDIPNSPDVEDWRKRQPIHFAASNIYDNSKVVEALVNARCDLNALDSLGKTPLHFSAFYHNIQITDVLLKYGADVNIQDYYGKTPLHYAASNDSPHLPKHENSLLIVKSLLENGAHVNSLSSNHDTPLMLAVKCSRLDIMKELFQWGADVHITNNQSRTCLHIASVSGVGCFGYSSHIRKYVYMELLKWGACTECFDEDGKTALDIILKYQMPHKLEEAKTFIKVATLAIAGKWTDFPHYIENNNMREFKEECEKEVARMTSIQCSTNFSLSDFILRGVCDIHGNSASEKRIVETVLEIIEKQIFPIYTDLIRDHFETSYLCEEISKMRIYVIHETTFVLLNYYVIKKICSYLSDNDLFIFFSALIKSPPL